MEIIPRCTNLFDSRIKASLVSPAMLGVGRTPLCMQVPAGQRHCHSDLLYIAFWGSVNAY